MQALPNLFDLPIAEPAAKLAYEAIQQGKNVFGVVHRQVLSNLKSTFYPRLGKVDSLDDETLEYVRNRQTDLLERDWQDAQEGVYPVSLLFDQPWDEFFRLYPQVWLDAPQIWQRVDQKKVQEFAPEIDVEGYPRYYIQNFHHQTDGYLSETSAEIYDLQVELLFGGTADAMRRRILAPLKRGLAAFSSIPANQIRILDVPCGAGRTLKQLRGTFPNASLYGVDLSPTYLQKANRLISQDRGVLPQLLQANAESLPYVDNYFHGISSVFLFHELPAPARQNVIDECFRVLRPGGTFVICDSIQLDDSPELKMAIDNFPVMMHEPYYRHYSTDNLVKRLQDVGFVDVETDVHFMSKYLFAHKPV